MSKRAQPYKKYGQDIKSLIKQYKQDPSNDKVFYHISIRYEKLIKSYATKYASREDIQEDLMQVGRMALFASLTRYNPTLNTRFESFAIPTIKGEMKKYLRDKSWSMKVPRKYKDLSYKVINVVDELTVKLEREPFVKEIAEKLNVSEEDILHTMEASNNYKALSVDREITDEKKGGKVSPLLEKIPSKEKECIYEKAVARLHISSMLEELTAREKKIIYYLYFEQLSQAQIGKIVGISQMHVSRLHKQAIRKLSENFSHHKKYY
ncbi:hypothetical protein CIB95_15475 [Lottiidibacillus patelloidae]|uniref:RNA polymerase sigma-70 domain-containing protein n=1 Tax=Lottiidibacillus patelloidae TaxID=2670334 RepID=A0A263BPT1_9BACI|nr:sigma-70 family RNA polymerase sigma factor [Lottiidibacillus patelloidae]OZM55761.1 hypothetical protein CIB95_15475 [Lottiidibacillus patelloidae]